MPGNTCEYVDGGGGGCGSLRRIRIVFLIRLVVRPVVAVRPGFLCSSGGQHTMEQSEVAEQE